MNSQLEQARQVSLAARAQRRADRERLLVPTDSDDCVDWLWATDAYGYAMHGRQKASHRALELAGQPRPHPAACALHSCDRPICVNARHLSWGDRKRNARERQERGRLDHKGEKNPKSKLVEAQVVEILRRVESGEDRTALAAEFGVSHGAVADIAAGRTWQHITSATIRDR